MAKSKYVTGEVESDAADEAVIEPPKYGKALTDLMAKFNAARRTGVPLVGIQSPDPAGIYEAFMGSIVGYNLILWDCTRGWTAKDPQSKEVIRRVMDGADPAMMVGNPAECLTQALRLPSKTILICMNMNRTLTGSREDVPIVQALWKLRDEFKTTSRMLVVVGAMFDLPPEIANDMFMLTEDLPDEVELDKIVGEVLRDISEFGIEMPSDEQREAIVDAVTGLPAFSAEQALSVSIDAVGKCVDMKALWDQKRVMINATPGLSVWQGGEKFDDIGGVRNAKKFMKMLTASEERRPRCIVFMDEIEKAMGGGGGQLDGGVSADYLRTILADMQDNEWTGVIFIGVAGSAKSMLAKATGNSIDVPTVALDLGGMKNSLVGASEANLRRAMGTIKAIAGKEAIFVATCNRIEALRPELRRRFSLGTIFFDTPDSEEREAIWNLYESKYQIDPDDERPDDTGWTGAEIKTCCMLARERMNCTLKEAAAYIVPVSVSARDEIERLRKDASGKFVSASHDGYYHHADAAEPVAEASGKSRRRMTA